MYSKRVRRGPSRDFPVIPAESMRPSGRETVTYVIRPPVNSSGDVYRTSQDRYQAGVDRPRRQRSSDSASTRRRRPVVVEVLPPRHSRRSQYHEDVGGFDVAPAARYEEPFEVHRAEVKRHERERFSARARTNRRESEPDLARDESRFYREADAPVVYEEPATYGGTAYVDDAADEDLAQHATSRDASVERVVHEEDGDEFIDAYEPFDFKFPASPPGTDTWKEFDSSDVDVLEVELEVVHDAEKNARLHGADTRAASVYSSQYNGTAILGGLHHMTLTSLHDPKGLKVPLFNWLHVRHKLMNFDEFWGEVSRLPHLSEAEKSALARTRAEVTKNCIRTRNNAKGDKVGYMDPRPYNVAIPSSQEKGSKQDSTANTIKWICMPYFTLGPYGGLVSASTVSAFPSQTLLQSQYSRSPQQRDMDQAVRQLGVGKKDDCFHIAQLWCLVIRDTYLITCGTMERSTLQGSLVNINSSLAPGRPLPMDSAAILVCNGPEVVFSLEPHECPTWFSFTSSFSTSWWPYNLVFKYRGETLREEDWPKILRLAARRKFRIRLQLEADTEMADAPTKACLKRAIASQKDDTSQETAGSKEKYLPVMTLQVDAGGGFPASEYHRSPRTTLAAVEKFLKEETSYMVQKIYESGRTATRQEAFKALLDLEQTIRDGPDETARQAYEDRIDVINAMDMVFRMFLPTDENGTMASKFWGACLNLLDMSERSNTQVKVYRVDDSLLASFRHSLRNLSRRVRAFQNLFASANSEERSKLRVPQDFLTAWLHLVVAVMLAGLNKLSWARHFYDAERLIESGILAMVQAAPKPDLLQRMTMLPMEVLSLGLTELLKDQVGKSDDILETYTQYLEFLDTNITNEPSDRTYQHRIDLLQQELSAVKRTLARQRWIVSCMKRMIQTTDDNAVVPSAWYDTRRKNDEGEAPRYRGVDRSGLRRYDDDYEEYGRGREGLRGDEDFLHADEQFIDDLEAAIKLSPTDPAGFRGLFLMECSRIVEQREFEFRRCTEYAEDLERAVSYKMEYTKDRQENAIYAFTLVTIVFLPLSAISSIFGMNTTDVRDMSHGQWLYWAVAIPVTLLVIVIGLWWMNELDNFTGWVLRRRPNRAIGGGNQTAVMASMPPVPSPAHGMDGYMAAQETGTEAAMDYDAGPPSRPQVAGDRMEVYEVPAPTTNRRERYGRQYYSVQRKVNKPQGLGRTWSERAVYR